MNASQYRKPFDRTPLVYKNNSLADSIDAYCRNIQEYPLITPEEERVLAERIAKGDEEALQTLIKSQLRLVVKIAHKFTGKGLSLLDLINEGNIGLMKTAPKFDPKKGARMSSWAAWQIKNHMRMAIETQTRAIRNPNRGGKKLSIILTEKSRLREELGREPSPEEIAKNTDFSPSYIRRLLGKARVTCTLDEGKATNIQDEQAHPYSFMNIENDELLRYMNPHQLEKLLGDAKAVKVICMRYGLNGYSAEKYAIIGKSIGRTRERARQIHDESIQKLQAIFLEKFGNRED